MHSLSVRTNPIVCLYVKALTATYQIRTVFQLARQMAPCLLILEDIDTLVTEALRSYFFNEVDGLENNDGIMMVATTNHLDRLDGGLAKRPSRFDRKFEFAVPTRDERILYCDYWKRKLRYNKDIEFPDALSPAIADITQDFTFAYLKEAFVATLLALARRGEDGDDDDDNDDELDDPQPSRHRASTDNNKDITTLPLWIEIQKQVKILREDMNSAVGRAQSRAPPSTSLPPLNQPGPFGRLNRDANDLALLTDPFPQEHVFRQRVAFNAQAGKRLPESEKDYLVQTFGEPRKSTIGLRRERRAGAGAGAGAPRLAD